MEQQYTYQISDFPNDKVNYDTLINEVQSSNITIALDRIDNNATQVIFVFKTELSDDEEDLLFNIVSNHTGADSVGEDTLVKIKEEEYTGETQGHFQACVIDLEITGKGTKHKDITFPFPISLFSAEWLVDIEHKGDRAEFHIAPDTIVGAITQSIDASGGLTTISVSPTVTENIQRGYFVKLGSSENAEIGRVVSYDNNEHTVTFENPIEDNYAAGSYVFMTVKVVDYWRFTATGFNSVGESKIGASFIPANTVLRMVYHSENDVSTNKLFGISIDYMY